MSVMPLIVFYFIMHFLLYVLKLRKLPAFAREGVIFLYHFVPAVIVTAGLLLAAWIDPAAFITFPSAVSVVCFQGIYSLSLLELWSLSEGGFSLSILDHIDRAERGGPPLDQRELEAIGDRKRSNRTGALTRLGLVRQSGDTFQLRPRGVWVATFLAVISWPANLKDIG